MALITGTNGDDTLTGTSGADIMFGLDGNDVLDGREGADQMAGGIGNDWYYVDDTGDVVTENGGEGDDRVFASISYALAAGTDVETLTTIDYTKTTAIDLTGNDIANFVYGNAGANILRGAGGNDILVGIGGNDVMDGGTGADTMIGGSDNDWYFVDQAGDLVIENAGEGDDRVFAGVSYALAVDAEVETLTTTDGFGTGTIDLTGNDASNFIYGNDGTNILRGGGGNDILASRAGNDVLDGGTGADTMAGQTGNDWYFVDNAGDVAVENAGEGDDRIFAGLSYALAAGAEIELLSTTANDGMAAIDLTGNELANFVYGNDGANALRGGGGNDFLASRAGNDVLDGGTGADTMIGAAGNDWYYVDNAGDLVTEYSGEGDDRLLTSISYALAASAEIETLSTTANDGTDAIDLTGSNSANFLYGNDGVNTLRGGGGNDVLASRAGNDVLDGGTGADTMIGQTGNDWYFVDNAGDVVVEGAGEGDDDRVFTSVSYALAANVQVETLSAANPAATTAINLTGNALTQTIIGNAGANLIDGGAGPDAMFGGPGSDIYIVDDVGDTVTDPDGGEIRTTLSSYTLVGTNFGALTGLSAFDQTLTGNDGGNILLGGAANDVLTGGAGHDRLDGRTGADTMIGGASSDWYFVDNAGDVVIEDGAGGDDRVYASASFALGPNTHVSYLLVANPGGTAAIDLTGSGLEFITGNAGPNTLRNGWFLDGGGGNDWLDGGTGNSRLNGGTGADTFAFTTALGADQVVRIVDFQEGIDKIALDHNVFTGLGLGTLPANAFVVGAAAQDADDRIIYDQGTLYFDADGNGAGAAVRFAGVSTVSYTVPIITASDFTVM